MQTATFAAMLPGIVDAISIEAQQFYDLHFAADDPAKVTLKLGVTTPPSCSGSNHHNFEFTIPVVEFGIQIGGTTVTRPQAFLNEAKLTQLALSVRFAAALVCAPVPFWTKRANHGPAAPQPDTRIQWQIEVNRRDGKDVEEWMNCGSEPEINVSDRKWLRNGYVNFL